MKLRTRYPTVRLWTVFLAVTPFILPFTFVIGELSCKYNFKTTFKDDQENQETSERNGTKDERGSIQVCVFVSFDEAKYYFQMAITKFASGGKNNYEGITVGGKETIIRLKPSILSLKTIVFVMFTVRNLITQL